MTTERGGEVTELRGNTLAINTDRSAPSPHCSSSSSRMVQVQGAMALARRLLLILLLLVALHARAAQAAPWRARDADEDGGSDYPASRLEVGVEPLRHPGDPLEVDGVQSSSSLPLSEPEISPPDVPAGRAFPVPWLHLVQESGWRRRGPPRANKPARRGKKFLEPSDNVKKSLQELERGRGTDREAARETAFREGRGGSLPASAAETEATRAPGTPVISKPTQDSGNRTESGVVGERTAKVSPLKHIASVFCPEDLWTICMCSIAALVLALTALLLAVCSCVYLCYRRKKRALAASRECLETGGHPSHPPNMEQPPWYP